MDLFPIVSQQSRFVLADGESDELKKAHRDSLMRRLEARPAMPV
jgi:hypothetical protein